MTDVCTVVDLERHLHRRNLLVALDLADAWAPAHRAQLDRLVTEEFGEGVVMARRAGYVGLWTAVRR